MKTLYSELYRASAAKTAAMWRGRSYSYAEFFERIEDYASHFQQQGVRVGDRIGIPAGHRVDYLAAVYACSRIGAVAVPFAPQDRQRAEGALQAAGVRLVAEHEPERGARSVEGITEAAMVIFTSGTTSEGRKGVILGQAGISGTASFMNRAMRVDQSIRECVFAPLDHAFAFGRCHAVLSIGGTLLLENESGGFEQFFSSLAEANALSTVPSILATLLRISRRRLELAGGGVRWIQTGAMRFDLSFREGLCDVFPAARIFLHYGLSEAMRVTFLDVHNEAHKRHTEGRPAEGVEIAILDEEGKPLPAGTEGRIAVRGRNLALGYIDAAAWQKVCRDGWFVTADRGKLDEDGYLVFSGRADDVINANGHIVHPDEIESRLHRLLRNRAFSVVGVPDPRGIKDKVIVLAVEGDAPSVEAIAAAMGNVPDFMIPRIVVAVDRLPTTATGKVIRAKLAADLAARVR